MLGPPRCSTDRMADITPFQISVSDAAIEDLKTRLNLAKFPDELDQAGWDLGSPLGDVKRLVAYWKDKYDWRKALQIGSCFAFLVMFSSFFLK